MEQNGFAVLCEARAGHELGINTLALVDRARTQNYWWTRDRADLIMRFHNRGSASAATRNLRLNYPQVVSYDTARRLIEEQAEQIQFHENMAEMGDEW